LSKTYVSHEEGERGRTYEIDQIESREEGGRELDVLHDTHVGVVATLNCGGGEGESDQGKRGGSGC
jgi:hypothetical protein